MRGNGGEMVMLEGSEGKGEEVRRRKVCLRGRKMGRKEGTGGGKMKGLRGV